MTVCLMSQFHAAAYHLCNTTISHNVSRMDQSIEKFSCLLNQVTLIGILINVIICTSKQNRKCECGTLTMSQQRHQEDTARQY